MWWWLCAVNLVKFGAGWISEASRRHGHNATTEAGDSLIGQLLPR